MKFKLGFSLDWLAELQFLRSISISLSSAPPL